MPVSIDAHLEGPNGDCSEYSLCGGHGRLYVLILNMNGVTARSKPLCESCFQSNYHNLVFMKEPKKRKAPSRRMKKLSQKQEQHIMDSIGGRTQAASGSRNGYKGDGRLYDRVRMEAKYTFAKVFKLRHADLSKVRGECEGHEEPALVVDFKEESTGRTKDRWVVVPFKAWMERINAAADDS